MINFGVVVVSDICIFWALCEEVQLRLRHSQHAVRAESVLNERARSVCAGLSLRPDCVH